MFECRIPENEIRRLRIRAIVFLIFGVLVFALDVANINNHLHAPKAAFTISVLTIMSFIYPIYGGLILKRIKYYHEAYVKISTDSIEYKWLSGYIRSIQGKANITNIEKVIDKKYGIEIVFRNGDVLRIGRKAEIKSGSFDGLKSFLLNQV